jgi:hypothetical protein
MVDLDPHKLVAEIAGELKGTEGAELAGLPRTPTAVQLADALARAEEIPELVIFAGFLGGEIARDDDPDRKWRLLYLDWKLVSWLLVPQDKIVFRGKLGDESAPFAERDAIWVLADARVKRGDGPQSTEARFLRGDFVRAGDISSGVTAGTFTPTTGLFCEATTPSCCGRPTRR